MKEGIKNEYEERTISKKWNNCLIILLMDREQHSAVAFILITMNKMKEVTDSKIMINLAFQVT